MNNVNGSGPLTFAISNETVISRAEVHLALDGHLDAEVAPVLSDELSKKLESGIQNVSSTDC